jgi:hypothetical protein
MLKKFLMQLEKRTPVESLLSRFKGLFEPNPSHHPHFTDEGIFISAGIPGKGRGFIPERGCAGRCQVGRVFPAGDVEEYRFAERVSHAIVSVGIPAG